MPYVTISWLSLPEQEFPYQIPAGLPSFSQLASEVAKGSGENQVQGETEDRFLGRLRDKGQEVHIQVARALQEKNPQPNGLHHDLTALYRNLESLRIVTSNFDTLFEEAAKTRFEPQPEAFRAPALPLGNDFNGIVHIHGSIDRPKDMVLTDADFGRAYLTEGWARGFLLELFRTFPVLFVGYGHNDTVMNYMARALPADRTQPRLALTDETDADRWAVLGVTPVLFPKTDASDYSGLYEGIAELAKYSTMGILGWQSRITDIAKNPPSLDQEAMDLVEDGLSNSARVRFFTETASHVEWIGWLDENGLLDSLFGTSLTPVSEDSTWTLGRWLARTFTKDHSDDLFRLIAKHGMDIHPGFWETLAWVVRSPEHAPKDAGTLARWISVLLETAPRRPATHFLLSLGERCAEADLMESLLDVFRRMAAYRTQLSERITFFQDVPGPMTTVEIKQVHGQWELNEFWEEGLKPNLNQVAEPLLEQLADSFTNRHRTRRAWESATRNWDPDSFGRSAIESHEQDDHPESIDVLIDAARDSLEYLAKTQPETAANWCDKYIRSAAPILRRLAVHTTTMRQDLTSSAKIDWLLKKTSLYDRPAHHELFRAIRSTYPHATPEQRQTIIEEVYKFNLPEQDGEDTARRIAYQHFSWFSWLSESDPDCDLVKQCIEEIREGYPEFKPRKWADMTHYSTGGIVEQRSPWTTDELLSKPANEWTEQLLSFRGTDTFDDSLVREDRVSLAKAVEDAANLDFKWSLDLANGLALSGNWESDLWTPLARSWARRQEEEEQREILKRLRSAELYGAHARTVTETLRQLTRTRISYSSGLLSEANQVAISLWDHLDEDEPVMPIEDWYGEAINHSAGILTQYWLYSTSSWYNQQDPHPPRISDEYSELLDKIVKRQTTGGKLGRSVIARELAFVMTVDEEWANERLIPLFVNEGKDDRQAVWYGLLHGRLSPAAADALQPAFLQAVSDMDDLFEQGRRIREQFISVYTAMVVYFADEPLSLWIPRFFAVAGAEDRRQFAWNLGNILRDMENETLHGLWRRWLSTYWENRLQGTPAPLDPTEAAEMIDWLPDLGCLYPQAVDLAIKMHIPQLQHSLIVYQLNQGEMWEHYPQATAKLLIYLADCNCNLGVWYKGGDLIQKLITQELPGDLNTELAAILARLGL